MSRPATPTSVARATPPLIWVALGAVYIIWGTTYLAIRVANRTLPPLMAASVRFLVAGALLYAWAIRRGDRRGDRPTRRQWRSAAIVGGLLLLGGNGAVVWAERTIPSGITALLIALVPLWIALFDRIVFKERQRPQVVLGVVAGFGGAALLVGTSARGHVDLTGMLFVVVASISWASGSLYGRTAPLPLRPPSRRRDGDALRWGAAGHRRGRHRRAREASLVQLLGGIAARARLPDHVRIMGWVRVVRLAASQRSDLARVHVRVREPGGRGLPRLAHLGRTRDGPIVRRRRDHRCSRRAHNLGRRNQASQRFRCRERGAGDGRRGRARARERSPRGAGPIRREQAR